MLRKELRKTVGESNLDSDRWNMAAKYTVDQISNGKIWNLQYDILFAQCRMGVGLLKLI